LLVKGGLLQDGRQRTTQIFIGFNNRTQGVGDIVQRFGNSITLGNQLRQDRTGYGISAFCLWFKEQRRFVDCSGSHGISPDLVRGCGRVAGASGRFLK
jgi:hypothetical protein